MSTGRLPDDSPPPLIKLMSAGHVDTEGGRIWSFQIIVRPIQSTRQTYVAALQKKKMAFCSSTPFVSSSLQQRSSLTWISERLPAKLSGSHSLKVHSLPLRFYSEKGSGVLVALRRQVRPTTSMAEIPSVQKGWRYSEYGPPDVLTFGELPVPQIADDQVGEYFWIISEFSLM